MAVRNEKTQLSELYEQMADSIAHRTLGQEDCTTAIQHLDLFRRESPTQPSACKIEPSLVIVVQGAKQLLVGDLTYSYDVNHFLINSLDIPGNSQALEASPDKPCLGMVIKLDLRIIAELIAQHDIHPLVNRADKGSSALGTVTHPVLEPCNRLLVLLDKPDSIPILAPLIEREIHYRLLKTDQAARLWQIASVGSMSHRIARAIDWLRINYALPLRIEELANYVKINEGCLDSSSMMTNFPLSNSSRNCLGI